MGSMTYAFPQQFCIDSSCQKSWKDRDWITSSNLMSKSIQLVQLLKTAAKAYKNPNVLFFMLGDDFAFRDSQSTFQQFDLLAGYINSRVNKFQINIQYSTPALYLQQLRKVNRHKNKIVDKKTKDFFPYADNPNEYWTGFYTSRPALKYKIRHFGRYLQTVRTFFGLLEWEYMINNNNSNSNNNNVTSSNDTSSTNIFEQEDKKKERKKQIQAIDKLEKAMGITQHHDAITGTSKEQVQKSYKSSLYSAMNMTQQVLLHAISRVTGQVFNQSVETGYKVFPCDHNEHYYLECYDMYSALEYKKDGLFISIYNPTAERVLVMKMKIPVTNIVLYDYRSKTYLLSDIFCDILSNTFCEVYFRVRLPKLAFTYLKVEYRPCKDKLDFMVKQQIVRPQQVRQIIYKKTQQQLQVGLVNGFIDISLQNINETIKQKEDEKNEEEEEKKEQQFSVQYKYATNDGKGGAYLFSGDESEGLKDYVQFKGILVFKGKLLTLLKAHDQTGIQCLVKYYPHHKINTFQDNLFEINTLIIDSQIDKEIFLRVLNPSLNNKQEFETDGNGLSLIKRKVNCQEDYKVETENQMRENIYPVTKILKLVDQETEEELIVVTDRSEGGTSLQQGSADLLIQRQSSSDDHKGMEEGLIEKDMILVTHYVLIGKHQEQRARKVQLHSDVYPLVNYGRGWQGCTGDSYIDNPTYIAPSIHLDPLVKVYIIYDRWTGVGRQVLRVQSYNLECGSEVEVEGVKEVQQMGLDYVQESSQVEENNSRLEWLEYTCPYVLRHALVQSTLSIQLPSGLDIYTYILSPINQ